MKNIPRIAIAAVFALALTIAFVGQASASIFIDVSTSVPFAPGGSEFSVIGEPGPTGLTAVSGSFDLGTLGGSGIIGSISVRETYFPAFPLVTAGARATTTVVDLTNVTLGVLTGTFTVDFTFLNPGVLPFPGPAAFSFSASSDEFSGSALVSGTSDVFPSTDLVFTTPLGPLVIDSAVNVLGNPVDPLDDFAFINVDAVSFTIRQTIDFTLTSGSSIQFNYTSELDASEGALLGLPEPTSIAIWSVLSGFGAIAGWRRSRRKS
jgi:hypothetical protein